MESSRRTETAAEEMGTLLRLVPNVGAQSVQSIFSAFRDIWMQPLEQAAQKAGEVLGKNPEHLNTADLFVSAMVLTPKAVGDGMARMMTAQHKAWEVGLAALGAYSSGMQGEHAREREHRNGRRK